MKKDKWRLDVDCIDNDLKEEYIRFMMNKEIDPKSEEGKKAYDELMDRLCFNLIANSKKDLCYGSALKMRLSMELGVQSMEAMVDLTEKVFKDFKI